jgi:phenylalanyl-tRNA synthetase beta subunit
MKVSYSWLSRYFKGSIPSPEKVAERLTANSFEVESVEKSGQDSVLDVKVLPDRAHDCLSHFGIAKEISILFHIPLKKESTSPHSISAPESNLLNVGAQDSDLCPRFSALVIENVEVKESPSWLKDLLVAIGQKPINNIVDATNFCMFAYGQPLHAYDLDKLSSNDEGFRLIAKPLGKAMKFSALDDKEYDLVKGDLVIFDEVSDSVLGIAGVKGGKVSQIGRNTKNIVIESANFNPISISKTSRRLSLFTDASKRFENGITPTLTLSGLTEVAKLILKIAGGEKTRLEGLCDFYPRKANSYKVGVSLSEIKETLGVEILQDEVEEIFNRCGFEWELVKPRERIVDTAKKLLNVPYKWGSSVLYDSPKTFDCASFCSYLYVQAGMAIPRMCPDQFLFGEEVLESDAKSGDLVFFKSKRTDVKPDMAGHDGVYIGNGEMIQAGGVDLGYGKVVREKVAESKYYQTGFFGYRRFVEREDEERFVVTIPDERLDLRIKEDLIEEVGRLYGYERVGSRALSQLAGEPEIDKISHYSDKIRDSFCLMGFSEVITSAFRTEGETEILNPVASDKSFLRKNLSESLQESLELNSKNADLLGSGQVKIFEIGNVFTTEGEESHLAFGIRNQKGFSGEKADQRAQEIINDLGKITGMRIEFSKSRDVYEARLELDNLPEPTESLSYTKEENYKYKKFSIFPFVLRDIATFLPESTSANELEEIIVDKGGELLVKSWLFDEFKKENKVSYAFRLVFQSSERTLTDKEVNDIMKNIESEINKKGWQVR